MLTGQEIMFSNPAKRGRETTRIVRVGNGGCPFPCADDEEVAILVAYGTAEMCWTDVKVVEGNNDDLARFHREFAAVRDEVMKRV